jgi:excisionase family DNA binding protein
VNVNKRSERSSTETAKALRVSTRLVYQLVETGALSAYRIGTAIRISDQQLQAYLDRCAPGAIPSAQESPITLRRLRV